MRRVLLHVHAATLGLMSWHPALSSTERATDLPQDRPRPVTDAQRRETGLKVTGTRDCWCGREPFHGWPGKDNGKPHPGRQVPLEETA